MLSCGVKKLCDNFELIFSSLFECSCPWIYYAVFAILSLSRWVSVCLLEVGRDVDTPFSIAIDFGNLGMTPKAETAMCHRHETMTECNSLFWSAEDTDLLLKKW